MRRKIFIAINLDDKTKKFIDGKLTVWKNSLPLKWTNPDNYHLTLHFIGYIDDEELERLIGRLKQRLEGISMFDVSLINIEWGPTGKKPKMLWLCGAINEELVNLRQTVESAVADFDVESKDFKPHLTLGRIARSTKDKELPEINQSVNILVPVLSVDVMESLVEQGKRKYYIMESIDLS